MARGDPVNMLLWFGMRGMGRSDLQNQIRGDHKNSAFLREMVLGYCYSKFVIVIMKRDFHEVFDGRASLH